MTLDLDAILRRAHDVATFSDLGGRGWSQNDTARELALRDVPALIAEIERLRQCWLAAAGKRDRLFPVIEAAKAWRADMADDMAISNAEEMRWMRVALRLAAAVDALTPACTCPDVDTTTLDQAPGTQTAKGLDPACPEHGDRHA